MSNHERSENLPEWIGKLNNSEEYWNDQDSQKILEALAIAWEALCNLDQMCTCGDNGATCEGCKIGDAMRRIEALGKDGGGE